jgi:hypothetical protein
LCSAQFSVRAIYLGFADAQRTIRRVIIAAECFYAATQHIGQNMTERPRAMNETSTLSIRRRSVADAAGIVNLRQGKSKAMPASPTAESGRLVELNGFGGSLAAPYGRAFAVAGRPRVVLLHGCSQDAAVFAADTGWIDLADRWSCRIKLRPT